MVLEPAQLASLWSCCYLAALNDVFHYVLLSLVGKCLPAFVSGWKNGKYFFFCYLRIGEKMGTSHFWLCFLASLCCFLFLFHSFPVSPFAELWETAGSGELLEAPECCNSYLPKKRGKSQQRNISEAMGNSTSFSALHTWKHKACLLPAICTIWETCLPAIAGTGQAQENGSCDQGMHVQLLGLGMPCPQQL